MDNGFANWPEDAKNAALELQADKQTSPIPSKDAFKENFSSLFCESMDDALLLMKRFSFLTNSQSSELSKIHFKAKPKLGLGSVLHSKENGYLLCLQATCDTVRGEGLFFFIPLEASAYAPDIVVPHGNFENKPSYICLTVPEKCYTKSLSLNFGPIDEEIGHIPVSYDSHRKIYYVIGVDRTKYRWLANLKYKRALRIAQNMSQEISRIGFDEFEPFRKN